MSRRQHAPDADGAADTRRRLARPRRAGRLHGSLQAGPAALQALSRVGLGAGVSESSGLGVVGRVATVVVELAVRGRPCLAAPRGSLVLFLLVTAGGAGGDPRRQLQLERAGAVQQPSVARRHGHAQGRAGPPPAASASAD